MPNEIRPCTLWGETFDACNFHMDYFEVFRNEEDCNYNVYFLGTKIATIDQYADSFPLYRQAITTIAEALNAPVLATEEVLAGLPKDAKLMTRTNFVEQGASGYWGYWEPNENGDFDLEPVQGERIKSNGCPKTAEYLRQFTLDGVRIKEKETSHD